MQIQHHKSNNRGIFFIEEDGEMIAEMTYAVPRNDLIIIEHTEVDEDIQGQDIGFELVQHAVEYARRHHIKIVPVCPFVKAVMDKKPDFQDVIY